MELDLDSFLQLQSSDDEDGGVPHRTVDEILNDSDFSSSSSSSFNTTHSRLREEIPLREEENSSKSYETKQYKKGLKAADAILKKIPDHGGWMNEFSGPLPPLFGSVKPNPKPGDNEIRYCSIPSYPQKLTIEFIIMLVDFFEYMQFPYYSFVDREIMYKVGCLFYAIYFIVSFPMFLRMDEKLRDLWDLPRVVVDALGAAMLVTIILDLWRIFLGPIIPVQEMKQCLQPGLPWFSQITSKAI